jgi:hypothetical protein
VSWALAALSILFLSGSAWHNRRTGYAKPVKPANLSQYHSSNHDTLQLMRLSAALHPAETVVAETVLTD